MFYLFLPLIVNHNTSLVSLYVSLIVYFIISYLNLLIYVIKLKYLLNPFCVVDGSLTCLDDPYPICLGAVETGTVLVLKRTRNHLRLQWVSAQSGWELRERKKERIRLDCKELTEEEVAEASAGSAWVEREFRSIPACHPELHREGTTLSPPYTSIQEFYNIWRFFEKYWAFLLSCLF